MNDGLRRLVSSLLYEGYALYPYTPGAVKNATPTPFGIAYPPAYAARLASVFDRVRVECVLEAEPDAELTLEVRFLQAAGERHAATERSVALGPVAAGALGDGIGSEFEFEGDERLRGRVRLRVRALEADGLHRVNACVHNLTAGEAAESTDRAEALRASLLSTHVVIETGSGRFISPLERDGPAGAAVAECESVNSWPVLAGAGAGDSAILGAAIALPDHPRLAPESLGGLFDNTEIEEALLLHVQALSDGEREQIEAQDPAVREMVERAAAATPDELLSLHGRLEEVPASAPADPGPPAEPGHPNPGEPMLEVGGVTFHKGGKVVLRPDAGRDVYDRMVAGRTATIERIYIDYEDEPHVAVTIDDDPAQELFRETGRYLFFRAGELEPAQ